MSPPLDLSKTELSLKFDPIELDIVQLRPDTRLPVDAVLSQVDFISITRTPAEVTLVAPRQWIQQLIDSNPTLSSAVTESLGERHSKVALKVRGPLDMSMTGVLSALAEPLRQASIPIYVLSTWDTDYVLIGAEEQAAAAEALQKAGWHFG
ncbi:hypothetical protein OIV83_006393 [Microbotryomycetes sp. JL201]|nr:hypothetical protein OIV83_006393 [Microbotryomycetes sp. JL201]